MPKTPVGVMEMLTALPQSEILRANLNLLLHTWVKKIEHLNYRNVDATAAYDDGWSHAVVACTDHLMEIVAARQPLTLDDVQAIFGRVTPPDKDEQRARLRS